MNQASNLQHINAGSKAEIQQLDAQLATTDDIQLQSVETQTNSSFTTEINKLGLNLKSGCNKSPVLERIEEKNNKPTQVENPSPLQNSESTSVRSIINEINKNIDSSRKQGLIKNIYSEHLKEPRGKEISKFFVENEKVKEISSVLQNSKEIHREIKKESSKELEKDKNKEYAKD